MTLRSRMSWTQPVATPWSTPVKKVWTRPFSSAPNALSNYPPHFTGLGPMQRVFHFPVMSFCNSRPWVTRYLIKSLLVRGAWMRLPVQYLSSSCFSNDLQKHFSPPNAFWKNSCSAFRCVPHVYLSHCRDLANIHTHMVIVGLRGPNL